MSFNYIKEAWSIYPNTKPTFRNLPLRLIDG